METGKIKCPVSECGKEYKNNAGLASHMAMAHNMTVGGEALPEGTLERRKANLSSALTKRLAVEKKPEHTVEARAKAGRTNTERHIEKLKEQGIYRCIECWLTNHRANDFITPTELGKHRRFKHGVLGRSHTAQTMRKLALANQTKEATKVAPEPIPEQFQCPHCPRVFPKQHGLSIHISQAHRDLPSTALAPPTSQELSNGHSHTVAFPNGRVESPKRRGHEPTPSDAAYIATVAVANLTGKLQGFILSASDELNIAPRDLARRCILVLSEHYST